MLVTESPHGQTSVNDVNVTASHAFLVDVAFLQVIFLISNILFDQNALKCHLILGVGKVRLIGPWHKIKIDRQFLVCYLYKQKT